MSQSVIRSLRSRMASRLPSEDMAIDMTIFEQFVRTRDGSPRVCFQR